MKSLLRFKPTRAQFIAAAIIATSMGMSYAAVTIPNSFTDGTPAVAAQVNANFSALANAMPAVKSVNTPHLAAVASTTGENIASITVTAPVDGQIVLDASGDIGINQTVAANNFVYTYLTTTSGGTSTTTKSFFALDTTGGAANRSWGNLHLTGVFPVTAGTPTTFYLTAGRDSSGVNIIFSGYGMARLTATFIPSVLP